MDSTKLMPRSLQTEGDRLLTVAQVAERLAASERRVWYLLADGTLPRLHLGRSTRVRASDLERLIAELAAQGERP
jgi:excisionase family DNA binding protein